MKLILATSSINRHRLFERLGIPFEIAHPDFEEKINSKISPAKQVEDFALGKAKSVYKKIDQSHDVLVIGFDSMIEFAGGSVGKPKNKQDAFDMLQKFVGEPQRVITGVSIVGNFMNKKIEHTFSESTNVLFRSATTDAEIHKYLEFDDWQGKCGSYSILGTGIFLLERIDGDFQNIVGVPVLKLGEVIRELTGKSPLELFTPHKK